MSNIITGSANTGPIFTKADIYSATLKYFKGDELATNVWIDKYCLKDTNANYLELTPDDMHKRLAKEFARIEQKYPNPLSYEEIYELLTNFKYVIPGGSILYGAGNPYSISSLGNCFVLESPQDSIGGIFKTGQEQAQLMKRRCGVGHDLSNLRPSKAKVTNSAGCSTGIPTWEDLYSNITRNIAQDGRRGALMLTLDINHPDIEQFITSKDDLNKVTGANISVKITDDFMKSVENDSDYILTFPYGIDTSNYKDTRSFEYGKVYPFQGQIGKGGSYVIVKAKELWDKLTHQAWKSAEPGVLFFDKIKSESITSCYGEEWEETSTNPCGEIPLCPYDSCRLLSVNLYSFVENPFTKDANFNYTMFKDVVYKAQRLMDDIVDLEEEKINLILNKIENDPEPEEIKVVERTLWFNIRKKLLEGRRTGLSAIGLADTFAALRKTYCSVESIKLAEEIYKQFAISAYKSSIDMAKERGAFPIFSYFTEESNPFIQRIIKELDPNIGYSGYGRRNIACLTIPPSGTISLLAGISSGIEPVYQLYYKRRYKVLDNSPYDFTDATGDKWKEYIVLHPKFKEWLKLHYNTYSDKKLLEIGEEFNWKDVNLEELSKLSPYYKSTAYEIDPLQRIKLQAKIQSWIDHSISSTINLQEDTTEEEVEKIYMEAWKQGCKGITIYRNNCRTGVLVDANKKTEEFKQHDAPKRPKTMKCNIHTTKINGKQFTVLVGLLNDKPYEIFASWSKELTSIYDPQGEIIKIKSGLYKLVTPSTERNISEMLTDEEETITRLVSTSLRHGANIRFIVEQLNKTNGDLTNFGKGIARILKRYISDKEDTKELCPECSSKLIYKDGCKQCSNCSYSRCG